MKTAEERNSETGGRRETWAAIPAIAAAAALLTSAKGGIHVGSSNHAGLLPVVRRMLDPGYLPGDFNIELRLYHHRVFARLLAWLSALLGEDRAVIALHGAGALLLAGALWALCRALGLRLWGYAASVLLLAAGFLWTGRGLEENDFIGTPEIQPPLFAHAFVLLALAMLIRSRYRWGAAFLGLAVLFHLQIGVIATLMLAPAYAAKLRAFGPAELGRLALCYLGPASPALLHLGRMMQGGLLRPASRTWSLPYYIDFRHPHHFELMSAAHGLWVGAHVLWLAGFWWWLRRTGHRQARAIGFFALSAAMLSAMALVHFADYYLIRQDRIANLQMIRLSPLITVLGSLALLVAADVFAESSRRAWMPIAIRAGAVLVGIAAVLQQLPRTEPPFHLGIVRYAEAQTNWGRICKWIHDNGPRDSVYLTPPGETGFTSIADRSDIVEFKINPDGALHMADWFERLNDLTAGKLPTDRGLKNRKPLSKAYEKLTAEQLLAVAQKYGARYAVLPRDSKASFEILYQNEGFRLVRLQAPGKER